MSQRLYVGNLSYAITEGDLRDAFGEFGCEKVDLMIDRVTGRGRGFAFVEIATPELANRAIETMNGKVVGGRTIRVSTAHAKGARGDRESGQQW